MTELEPLDAPDLASRSAPGDPVPWLRLELLALRNRPELRSLLDPDATVPADRGAQAGCLPLGLACVGVGGGLGGSYLAGRTTPRGYFEVGAYATAGAVLTGLLLLVLVTMVVAFLRVLRTPWDGPAAGSAGAVGLLAAVGGWIALLTRTPEARAWDAAYWWTWGPSTVACVLLGLALLVLAVRKVATYRPPPPPPSPEQRAADGLRRRAAADAVLGAMAPWTRAQAQREIAAAVDDLERRRVITEHEAQRARSAPLARLAAAMAGPVDGPPNGPGSGPGVG
ncbi:hypothetical protein RDV89_16270 [Nocardioides zeae]|uniref:Uncharacterized protein n=1 Tax=Nocardioides imazamoxiresistens TaxID=3231893 RepID=A0ABU3Q0R5_9ACTN|nr:hypothetical protein [Nocardioides zeae]MDT9594642.1 hypothetical protein [Nocardioides zeae]